MLVDQGWGDPKRLQLQQKPLMENEEKMRKEEN
jgi:hypothetical protein